eukprot:Gregarina_sp_Pseudo_9__826@NODE_1529_length_1521_cov_1476_539136_g1417_i0_p1_GENE_NODE_1529_length_1521_cov_1476_539136_g1417_i0NODE_1529_length_1521_cov_1476_539136_g1417_i0_p1_ORF_typecomplete_len428_score12_72PAN_4/PF14295_6/7_2e03PAN_4/PF14295_6/7_4e03PAN_4/PF14295_6/3_2e05PAN_4/PF14295_6/1_3e03_NODE_1529_length_1521_cov_1476_539136_g1417_i01231406
MKFVSQTILIASALAESWDYDWPYGANNTCKCQEVPALGEFFTSEDECLEAYADDEYQWCYHEGQGITDAQCDEAVTIAEGVTNDLCSSMCTNLVAGTLPYDEFETSCKFNFYADFEDEVAVGWTSCFSNLVYGWSDYDPSNSVQAAPLRVFSNVEGPVQCQALCQALDDCVYWTWRAYSDSEDEGSAIAYQNEPLTCLVFGQDYIDGVLNTAMPVSDAFAVPTPYCNFPAITECMVDPFGRDEVDYFNPYSCLMCGCVGKCAWKSPYHLSGPAFCEPEYRDECSYKRPVWTSTMPPCESEPETSSTTIELEATESTIELDSQPTLEPSDSVTTVALEEGDVVTYPLTVGTSTTTPEEFVTEQITVGTSTTPRSASATEDSSVTAVGTVGTQTTTSKAQECGDDCDEEDEDDSFVDCEDCDDECIDC